MMKSVFSFWPMGWLVVHSWRAFLTRWSVLYFTHLLGEGESANGDGCPEGCDVVRPGIDWFGVDDALGVGVGVWGGGGGGGGRCSCLLCMKQRRVSKRQDMFLSLRLSFFAELISSLHLSNLLSEFSFFPSSNSGCPGPLFLSSFVP